jgi:hypothetical protein
MHVVKPLVRVELPFVDETEAVHGAVDDVQLGPVFVRQLSAGRREGREADVAIHAAVHAQAAGAAPVRSCGEKFSEYATRVVERVGRRALDRHLAKGGAGRSRRRDAIAAAASRDIFQ